MHGSPKGEPKENDGKIQKEEATTPISTNTLAHGHVTYQSALALGDQNVAWKFH